MTFEGPCTQGSIGISEVCFPGTACRTTDIGYVYCVGTEMSVIQAGPCVHEVSGSLGGRFYTDHLRKVTAETRAHMCCD